MKLIARRWEEDVAKIAKLEALLFRCAELLTCLRRGNCWDDMNEFDELIASIQIETGWRDEE